MAFHVGADRLPIMLEDNFGINRITDFALKNDSIELTVERLPQGDTFVKCQYGCNPTGLIQDTGTQLPVLCFSKVLVDFEKNG